MSLTLTIAVPVTFPRCARIARWGQHRYLDCSDPSR
jgi:hypothetical protein